MGNGQWAMGNGRWAMDDGHDKNTIKFIYAHLSLLSFDKYTSAGCLVSGGCNQNK